MNKTKISAEIVADSLDSRGNRLTSLLITFPRIILAEINTHRMLSKNTSSSRAIPFKKMVESVQNNPFIPIAWQKHHSGMQGNEYLVHPLEIKEAQQMWKRSLDYALASAKDVYKTGVTKQLCNRLLEPFMWTTMLITGSKEGWDNFFELRCPNYVSPVTGNSYKSRADYIFNEENPKCSDLEWMYLNKGQAEIHMMALAESIYDAMNESNPKQLKEGEWHIPFENKIYPIIERVFKDIPDNECWNGDFNEKMIAISTAMAARTSYTVIEEEKEIDYKKMIELHDRLLSQDPPHSSPLEHCARAMSNEEYKVFIKGKNIGTIAPYLYLFDDTSKGWCNNLKGFIPYRYMIDNNLI